MADALNHALPTADELEGAIAGLTAAGLAAVAGNTYALTELGCEQYLRASVPGRRHLDVFLDLIAAWQRAFPPDLSKDQTR